MVNLSSVTSLTIPQWKVFIESWIMYLKWDIKISAFNYNKWKDSINVSTEAQQSAEVDLDEVNQLIKINEKAGRNHIRKMNCLRRCLCQKQLLAKRSINTKLHFGVQLNNGQLSAHSWLTCQGRIINDSIEETSKYKELTDTATIDRIKTFI